MNLQEYKTQLLARADVVDLNMIEPVEMVPVIENGQKTGQYFKKVWETETGKTRCKYDVHFVQKQPQQVVQPDGSIATEYLEKDVIEQITVIDEGKATEEVVYRQKVAEVDVRTEVQKVKAFLPDVEKEYVRVENIAYDPRDLKAEFTGVIDNGDGTVTKERVFGWIDETGQPQKRVVKDANANTV